MGILITSFKPHNNLPDPLDTGWKDGKVFVKNEKVRTLKCMFYPRVGHEKYFG